MDGSGNISATNELNLTGVTTALYKMRGTTVIDNNGTFVGNGVNTPTAGHAASGFNPFVGGIQYFGVASITFLTGDGRTVTIKGGSTVSVV